jgi:hypothetical protein
LNVSEQQPETVSGDTGSVATEPSTPDFSGQSVPVTAAAEVEAPRLAPDQEEIAPKVEAARVDAPRIEVPKAEASKAEAPKVEAAEPEPLRFPGTMMIMSPGERAWNADEASSKPEAEPAKASSGNRRIAATVAVVALATVAGALGGALATAGIGHFIGSDQAVARDVAKDVVKDSALEATVARIDADITALKASVEHTTKIGMSQFNKTSDRLDKVEKAQAEPAAKLAELSKAVDKLRATPPAAPAVAAATPVAAREVTGTVTAPATAAAAPAAPSKPEVARLPTVEGWVLRDVANGGALIEGRQGMYEVYAGDPVPGLGRIDAIRKQDGRWVVVTTKVLIVAR